MKKKLLFVIPMLACLTATQINFFPNEDTNELAGPKPTEFSNDNKGFYIGTHKASEGDVRPSELVIHYQSDDPTVDYSKKRFYLWTESKDGAEYEHTTDDFGMVVTVNPREFGAHNKFMMIIKDAGTWAGQSTDTEIPYDKFPADENGRLEVWVVDGEGKSLEVYATKAETEGGKILTAKFKDWKTIDVEGSVDITEWKLYAYTGEYYGLSSTFKDLVKDDYLVGTGSNVEDSSKLEIKLPYNTPASLNYIVRTTFETGKTKQRLVSMENLYETERFETYYTYDGDDLGVTYTKDKSTFKLWAPTCARVALRIYRKGTPSFLDSTLGNDFYDEYAMSYTSGGVWSCEIEKDLNGKYYTYVISNTSGENEVCDPYAKASGINGIRGMILDFDTTDPEGWDEVPDVWDGVEGYDIENPNDLAIYETHIRDVTMDDTWNGTSKQGTYDAFAEKGTTYTADGVTVKTGHDHIEELGVNAVQILPFFDGANSEIDSDPTDNKIDATFNWGYNPLNYNVLEGMYSVNPHDGALRVKEFKNLVKSYATDANHTRIIMDVVYNHVASVSSNALNKIMPKYYFRVLEGGIYADGAGCGNEVKSEAPMMRKFIVDSVSWWASEYKIKGFRFDLMKIIDTTTMKLVKDAVYAIDPDNVCYGEGWALGYSGPFETHKDENDKTVIDVAGTETSNVYNMLFSTPDSPGHLGAFSDGFRNAIRGGNDGGWGSTDKHPGYGFIAQGPEHASGNAQSVMDGILGIHKGVGANSYQTVNYASCHDNYTLYDQLYWTLGDHNNGDVKPKFNEIAEGLLAVQSTVAFSSGLAFFNGGEELFRSKVEVDTELDPGEIQYFEYLYDTPISHNSYASSDEVNAYKYDQKISVNYEGEKIATNHYFKKYCEMIHARNEFESRVPYPANSDRKNNVVSTWSNVGWGSTCLGVYINYNNATYWMFLGGRTGGSIGFDASNRATCIYNSLGDAMTGASMYGSSLSMSPRQFLVFKAN